MTLHENKLTYLTECYGELPFRYSRDPINNKLMEYIGIPEDYEIDGGRHFDFVWHRIR